MRPWLGWLGELAAFERDRLRRGLSRKVLGAAVALFAALAALEGLLILLWGGYASLAEVLSPWAAGLIIGGAALFLAAVTLAVAMAILRRRDSPRETPFPPFRGAEQKGPELLGAAASEIVNKADLKARDLAALALVAGLLLGASPRLRHWLWGRKPKE
ncbi:hypothetical protein [Candidatus Methylocalor cossyra]|uniref:Phage holin family protein n=1 Tax=Candidatus Methylocalor cossyra TaxID=3108543 RepID=A0ABM9NH55_9GAMM